MLETPNRNFWTNIKCFMLLVFTCNLVMNLFEFTPYEPVESPQKRYWPSNPVYTLYNKQRYVYPMNLLWPGDYGTLLDMKNSTFIVMHFVDQEPLLLIVLVHSAVLNYKKRKVIRETWGQQTDERVKVLFVLGKLEFEQSEVAYENVVFNDLIQGDFTDSYKHMTYKHVMALKYVIYHAPQARYILKTDDDVFVNMPTLINFLTNDLSPYGTENMLLCELKKNETIMRTNRSKQKISFYYYTLKYYPPYCRGWAVLYSPNVVFKLYRAAQTTEHFISMDNIHVTGVLALWSDVIHTPIEPLMISARDQLAITKHYRNISVRFVFGRPEQTEESIRKMWHYVNTHPVPKSVLEQLPRRKEGNYTL